MEQQPRSPEKSRKKRSFSPSEAHQKCRGLTSPARALTAVTCRSSGGSVSAFSDLQRPWERKEVRQSRFCVLDEAIDCDLVAIVLLAIDQSRRIFFFGDDWGFARPLKE